MRRALILLTFSAFLLQGCEVFHSDSQNFAIKSERERARAVQAMREATAQDSGAGKKVSPTELVALVSGRTHEFFYGVDPLGHKGRYVEYSYFAPDGHLVQRNSMFPGEAGDPASSWRVEARRLCIRDLDFSPDEGCYTLSRLPDGRVQYFISAPGTETDGLLTKVTSAIEDGAPKP